MRQLTGRGTAQPTGNNRPNRRAPPIWACLATAQSPERTPLTRAEFTGPEGHLLCVGAEATISLVSQWAWTWLPEQDALAGAYGI